MLQRTVDRLLVHSFQSLFADLTTTAARRIGPMDVKGSRPEGCTLITVPTRLQRRAFQLLDVSRCLGYTWAAPVGEVPGQVVVASTSGGVTLCSSRSEHKREATAGARCRVLRGPRVDGER